MMRLTIAVMCLLFVACASKQEVQHMNIAITLTDSALDYAMQGQAKMAEFTYNKAIEKFRDMGRFCDMSRVAIVMHSVSQNIAFDTLEDARAFALLGACKNELNIISYLGGHPYNLSELEQPYKAIAESEKEGSISPLKGALYSSGDRVKSELYRKMAAMLINQGKTDDASGYINDARTLDSLHAWTSNLLSDELLWRQILEKEGKPLDIIDRRIDTMRKAIKSKF